MAKTFRTLTVDLRDPPGFGWDHITVSLAFRDGSGAYLTPPTVVVSPAPYYEGTDVLEYTTLIEEEPQPGISLVRDIASGAPTELLFSFSADMTPENVDVRLTWVPGY